MLGSAKPKRPHQSHRRSVKPLKSAKKYLAEIRTQSVEELNKELVQAKRELFNLRFQNATNQLDNTARITEVRRNIARIKTIMTQKQRA